MSEDVPVKPPRPSYVLRRHERDAPRPSKERDFGGSLDTATSPRSPAAAVAAPASRPANKRLSYSSDDKRKRFGTVQYFDDFQLPEKPSSSGASSKVSRSRLYSIIKSLIHEIWCQYNLIYDSRYFRPNTSLEESLHASYYCFRCSYAFTFGILLH